MFSRVELRAKKWDKVGSYWEIFCKTQWGQQKSNTSTLPQRKKN
jgi:hypothetical protein